MGARFVGFASRRDLSIRSVPGVDQGRRRAAARTTVLYAFDLIEYDGEDLRDRPFLDRKAALARLLRNTEAGILFDEHIAQDGPTVYAHTCRPGGRRHRVAEGG